MPVKRTELQQAFADQAEACTRLGSPFTALICGLFAKRKLPRGPVTDKLNSWAGDLGAKGESVPLRVAGALHALVLERKSEALAQLYPVNDPDRTESRIDQSELWAAISDALVEHKLFFLSRLQLAPQTNEVRRSGVLIAALLTLTERTGLPLALSELGASAGLNLHPEEYRYQLGDTAYGNLDSPIVLSPDWTGTLPPQLALRIVDRAGCDLHPLDAGDRLDQLKLLSFIWPDQHERMARTRAACRIAASGPTPASANAAHWLEKRLAKPLPGATHVVFHTIAWQYFSQADARECELLISEAGARASAEAPLAWLRLESDGKQAGAALTLTLWPGGKSHPIGRADYHGRWVTWRGWPVAKKHGVKAPAKKPASGKSQPAARPKAAKGKARKAKIRS